MGPHTFLVTFQVMNINPSYNCLLGRSWIHAAEVVTSTLHQRLKFIVDDKLIIVEGEEDMFIINLSSFRFIEDDGETLEIPFQALEIVVVSQRRDVPKKEKSTSSWEKMSELIRSRYMLGYGNLLEILEKKDRFGLGYKPINIESQKINQRNFFTLQDTFHNAGYISDDRVDVIEEEDEWIPNLVGRCLPYAAFNHLKAIEIPEMIFISK